MASVRRARCGALLLAVVLAAAGPAAACVGDCDGDGAVGIAELITGVVIGLGAGSLDDCPAFDATPDGELRIDELIRGVASALDGCPGTPTATTPPSAAATPTHSPTPPITGTATPAETPSAMPTLPPVGGTWIEEPLAVVASTCLAPVTEAFADDLESRPACRQTVELLGGTAVAVEDCTGTRVEGTLERDGTIRVTYPPAGDSVGGCTVELAASAVVPAGVAPTIATYTFGVDFSGDDCPLADCVIQAEAEWAKL